MSVSQRNPAVTQNEKVFPVLAQRLASGDIHEYLVTTNKLINWLKSDRAYYPAARQKIIELLEAAYVSFTDLMHHGEATSLTAHSLRELVQVVVLHAHRFVEAPLQARLYRVMHDTANIKNFTPDSTVQTSSSTFVRDNTGAHSTTTSVTTAEAIPSPTDLQTPTPPHMELPNTAIEPSITSSSMSKVKDEPEVPQIPLVSHAAPQGVPVAAGNPTPPHSEQPISPSSNQPPNGLHASSSNVGLSSVPPSIVPKPQPKRVRKPVLSKLIARDLDWYRSQSAVSGPEQQSLLARPSRTQMPAPMAIDTEAETTGPDAQPFLPVENHLPTEVQAEPGVGMDVDSMATSAGAAQQALPAENLPAQAPTEPITMDIEETTFGSSAIQQSHSAEQLPMQVSTDPMTMDVDIPPPEHPSLDVPTAVDNEQPSFEVASDAKETVISLPQGDNVQDTVKTDPSAPSPSTESPQHDIAIEAEDIGVSTGAGMKPDSLSFPPPPPPPESLYNGADDKTVSSTDASDLPPPGPVKARAVIATDVIDAPSETVPHSASPLSLLSAPLVELPQDIFTVSPDTIPAPIFEALQPQALPTVPQVSETAKFGEMVVLRLIRGKSLRHTHNINFALTETMYTSVSRWVNRQSVPGQVSDSICISLACYRLPDLHAASQLAPKGEDPSAAFLTSRTSCSWPDSGRLSLRVKCDGKDRNIPLSPPFVLTPEKCVDMSSFMKLDDNSFQIVQYGDLSDYAFVFHAHHPTPAQLVHLNKICAANEQWKTFVDSLCSPVTLEPLWENALALPALQKRNVGLV